MDTNSNSKTKIGVLLVGHGSRLPYGKDVVSQIATMYREDEGTTRGSRLYEHVKTIHTRSN